MQARSLFLPQKILQQTKYNQTYFDIEIRGRRTEPVEWCVSQNYAFDLLTDEYGKNILRFYKEEDAVLFKMFHE